MADSVRFRLRHLWTASLSFHRDRCFDQAAVISYFSLLSLVPLLLLLVAFGAWVLGSTELATAGTRGLTQPFLQDLDARLVEQARRVSRESGHEWAFLVLALWTASKVFSKIQASLDRILGSAARRSYPLRKLVVFSLVLLLGVVSVTMILVESGMSVLERRFDSSQVAWVFETPWYVWLDRWGTRYAIPWMTTVAGFSIIYRYLPGRRVRLSVALTSAVCAGSLWELAKAGFSYYVGHFASYSRTYGAFEAVVVSLIWIHLSASILLWGAELAAAMLESREEESGLVRG